MTSERFKYIRMALGLSQNSMADHLGLTDSRAIREYEAGTRAISGPISILMEIFEENGLPPYEQQNQN